MGVVVTYDVASCREGVTGVMLTRGYSRGWTLNGVEHTLPDGSLWHETASVDTAIADLQSAAEHCGTKLKGTMAVQTARWTLPDPP
jgi:hypothetical protein